MSLYPSDILSEIILNSINHVDFTFEEKSNTTVYSIVNIMHLPLCSITLYVVQYCQEHHKKIFQIDLSKIYPLQQVGEVFRYIWDMCQALVDSRGSWSLYSALGPGTLLYESFSSLQDHPCLTVDEARKTFLYLSQVEKNHLRESLLLHQRKLIITLSV